MNLNGTIKIHDDITLRTVRDIAFHDKRQLKRELSNIEYGYVTIKFSEKWYNNLNDIIKNQKTEI